MVRRSVVPDRSECHRVGAARARRGAARRPLRGYGRRAARGLGYRRRRPDGAAREELGDGFPLRLAQGIALLSHPAGRERGDNHLRRELPHLR